MPKKISFIYFDLAGVQFNFRDGITQLAEQHGLSYLEFAQKVRPYEKKTLLGKLTFPDLFEKYKKILNLHSPGQIDPFDFWTNLFKPISQTHELVYHMSKKYPVGLLTDIYQDLLPVLLKKKLVADIPYATIIQSFEVKHIKPQKEMFLIAQKQAGVPPEEILFIDDQNRNIETAKKMGWNGILYV